MSTGQPVEAAYVGTSVPAANTIDGQASNMHLSNPNSGIVQAIDGRRLGGMTSKSNKRKKGVKGHAARMNISPGGPGTFSAMQIGDQTLGGAHSNMALTQQARAPQSMGGNLPN